MTQKRAYFYAISVESLFCLIVLGTDHIGHDMRETLFELCEENVKICCAKISQKISVTSHNLSLVSPNYICPTAPSSPSKEVDKVFIIYQPFIIPVLKLHSKKVGKKIWSRC